jgi:hypothetical protein
MLISNTDAKILHGNKHLKKTVLFFIYMFKNLLNVGRTER